MTAPAVLSCPKCQATLTGLLRAPGFGDPCPVCSRPVEGLVFPAFHRAQEAGRAAQALIAAEDAGCFFHPQSRAEVPCDICGRFLCALCDVNLHGQHLCPNCVNAAQKKKQIRHIDGDRILWGGIALTLAVVPVLTVWFLTIVTGPLSVFLAIYGWRKPQSLTGPHRTSYILAIILGLAQTAAWVALFAGLFKLF